MTQALLLLLAQGFKIEATLADAPGPRLACEGKAEIHDGVVLNLELFISTREEKLDGYIVRVKNGAFRGDFAPFKGRERNLPGAYKVRVTYHPAFQPQILPDVAAFHVDFPLRLGTPAEIEATHKAARDRIIADVKAFAAVADDVRTAYEAAKGKPDPAEWRKRVPAWQKACTDIEQRAAADPDYNALGFGRITMISTEYLREKVRGLVEFGGSSRDADFQLGREQLDLMIRSIVLELAPAGSSTAERRTLIGKARGALPAALEAEGPAFPATRKAFVESVLRLNLKAPAEARDLLTEISSDGVRFFDTADADRLKAKPLIEPLDKKLEILLRLLTKNE